MLIGPNIIHQTNEKVQMIKERLKTSLSRKKSYVDQRKPLEFFVGEHVFITITPFTSSGVGGAIKSKKLTSKFIQPYKILKRIGLVAHEPALSSPLTNIHNIFHVLKLRKYVSYQNHILKFTSGKRKFTLLSVVG